MTTKLEYLSATEIGRAVNARQLSPVEVVDYFEKRVEERNKSINAFVYTKFDSAREEAKKLEKRLVNKENIGPFAGVPFGLKDFLPNKKGWLSTHGGIRCLTTEDTTNSVFCDAMEKAGGIAVGKTNAPAYGFRGITDNKLYGPTCNPFDIRYNSGGSSGGSAAAVADGLVPISEGGDAGGSIRIPAAWCNCFGYKASLGTIPSVCRPDAWAATHPFCFNGGITRTVEDLIVLLSYMAYFDPKDPFSRKNNLSDIKADVKGLKIGYTPNFNLFPVEPEIKDIVERAALRFAEAGAHVEPITCNFNHTREELEQAWCRGICVDSTIEFELLKKQGIDLLKDNAEDFPEALIKWTEITKNSTIMDYYNFNCIRTDVIDMFEQLFDKYDLVLSPVSNCLPVMNSDNHDTTGPEIIAGERVDPFIGFAQTYLANFSGNPAAAIPAGLSKSGLPVGMQIIGRRFDDASVLDASLVFEKLQPWKHYYEKAYQRI